MQKIKKEEIRLTWPQIFSVVSTLPLLKIAHFVGHICLFIFLDSGKVPPGQIKHLSFSIGWFRKVTADKSRFSNICWVEKRTEYVTVRHWKSDWSQENKLCWMGDDIFGVVINLNVQNQWMVRVSNLVELDFNVL